MKNQETNARPEKFSRHFPTFVKMRCALVKMKSECFFIAGKVIRKYFFSAVKIAILTVALYGWWNASHKFSPSSKPIDESTPEGRAELRRQRDALMSRMMKLRYDILRGAQKTLQF